MMSRRLERQTRSAPPPCSLATGTKIQKLMSSIVGRSIRVEFTVLNTNGDQDRQPASDPQPRQPKRDAPNPPIHGFAFDEGIPTEPTSPNSLRPPTV